jgi:hypothetical protein
MHIARHNPCALHWAVLFTTVMATEGVLVLSWQLHVLKGSLCRALCPAFPSLWVTHVCCVGHELLQEPTLTALLLASTSTKLFSQLWSMAQSRRRCVHQQQELLPSCHTPAVMPWSIMQCALPARPHTAVAGGGCLLAALLLVLCPVAPYEDFAGLIDW